MFLNNRLSISLLLLLSISTLHLVSCQNPSSKEDASASTSNEKTSSAEAAPAEAAPVSPQDTFSKRSGGEDVPDQLAVESNNDPVEHRGEPGSPSRPIPIPISVAPFHGNIVLPMPPGFGPVPHGGPPPGFRVQGPIGMHHHRPQGPHPNHLGPHGDKSGKSKEIFNTGPIIISTAPPPQGQPPQQIHQHHHQQHQQIHDHLRQQAVQQQILASTSAEIGIHPNHKPANIPVPPHFQQQQLHKQQQHPQQHQQGPPPPPPGPSFPKIMNTPSASMTAPQTFGEIRPQGPQQQQPLGPKPAPPGFQGTDAQFANSVFRELFDSKQKEKLRQQQGPFFGGPRPHKEIVSNDLQAEGGQFGPPVHSQYAPAPAVVVQPVQEHFAAPVAIAPVLHQQYGSPAGALAASAAGPWPETPDGDMSKIVSLEVKCEKNVMRVYVAFDKPFHGVIFSKGHYHNIHCIHLPAGLGHTSANFDIGIDSCGTQGNTENGLYGYGVQSGSGSFFENIIVIQYDPQVQEVWDQARKLRCTWHDQYEKSVTFRPFPVDMLDVVRADFAGDNVGCWMQIQVGKGPWASEVSGLVKIGQTMTMVLAIKDDDNKFDMLVRNCMAHDGVRAPIQLVDQWGCVTRPKLMSRFTKIKNFGQSASVLSYAHFQAFKFPDSMEVHFQCTIQICRYQCPEQCTQPNEVAAQPGYAGHLGKAGLAMDREEAVRRRKRSPLNETDVDIFEFQTTFKSIVPSSDSEDEENVGLNRVITVVSDGDLDFISGRTNSEDSTDVPVIEAAEIMGDIVCMSTFGFASMLTVLIGTLLIACIVSAVIVLRRPRHKHHR